MYACLDRTLSAELFHIDTLMSSTKTRMATTAQSKRLLAREMRSGSSLQPAPIFRSLQCLDLNMGMLKLTLTPFVFGKPNSVTSQMALKSLLTSSSPLVRQNGM